MKFLCVECDESMALKGAEGPNAGSMSVLFECRSCGRQIAMLTNPMETQMVRSLGVKVGGRTEAAPPMETIRTSMKTRAGSEPGKAAPDGVAPGAEAPGGDGAAASQTAQGQSPENPTDQSAVSSSEEAAPESSQEAKTGTCPFSAMLGGMEADGSPEAPANDTQFTHGGPATAPPDLEWTDGARARMERIPQFIRPMIERGIEDYARQNGIATIDEEVLATVRGGMGM